MRSPAHECVDFSRIPTAPGVSPRYNTAMSTPSREQAPRYRLGDSTTFLSPIGLGTWQFSQGRGMIGKFWPSLSDDAVTDIVKHALLGGINWFDTAEAYGRGQSERALAHALSALEVPAGQALIATKWWPVLRSSQSLERSVQERRALLQERPITLYQIHQPYSRSPIAAQMAAMARLIDRGLIQHAGVSNFSAQQMAEAHRALKAHGYRLVSNQVRYNLLDRQVETNGVLETAQNLGISIIAYSPLAQGLLTGKFHFGSARPRGVRRWDPHFRAAYLHKTEPLLRCVQAIAEANQVTPAQVALNWLITTPGQCVLAIPGATSVEQASQNAAAMLWTLSASDRAALDRVQG